MAVVQIEDLPDSSRTWVFGSDRTLDAEKSKILMKEVDAFLHQWKAHGEELTTGRDWRYGRFLMVAVDQSSAGASGCSIDGLFRALKSLEPKLGASLVTSGLIFYCDEDGAVQSVTRERFGALGAQGKIGPQTRVFDPTVTSLGEWRARFVLDLKDSWHFKLIKQNQPA
ncbi:MAG TPA: hypothetical protein VGJ47_04110 [Gemmatimonadaceae bacterium]